MSCKNAFIPLQEMPRALVPLDIYLAFRQLLKKVCSLIQAHTRTNIYVTDQREKEERLAETSHCTYYQ